MSAAGCRHQRQHRNVWLLPAAVLLWLSVLFAAAPLDLELARRVYQPGHWLAQVVATWGELPAWLVLLFAVAWAVRERRSRRYWHPLALALVVLALVEPLLVTQTLKLLWGRVRFRNLMPGAADYTPFYLPAGPGAGRSFPSGHVAMAWITCCLAFYWQRLGRWRVALAAWLLVLAYGVAVLLGRMLAGAHYLSDCLFSAGLDLLLGWWLVRRFTAGPAPPAGPVP